MLEKLNDQEKQLFALAQQVQDGMAERAVLEKEARRAEAEVAKLKAEVASAGESLRAA